MSSEDQKEIEGHLKDLFGPIKVKKEAVNRLSIVENFIEAGNLYFLTLSNNLDGHKQFQLKTLSEINIELEALQVQDARDEEDGKNRSPETPS